MLSKPASPPQLDCTQFDKNRELRPPFFRGLTYISRAVFNARRQSVSES